MLSATSTSPYEPHLLDPELPTDASCVSVDIQYNSALISHPDFKEALEVTAKVKLTFKDTKDDLHRRGHRLIRESLQAGVTCLRAHVEVDSIVADTCLQVGLQLKSKWARRCDIHLARKIQLHRE